MKTLYDNDGFKIQLQAGEDGLWLHMSTPSKSHGAINLGRHQDKTIVTRVWRELWEHIYDVS